MDFYNTFKDQIEILPRVTIIYTRSDEYQKGIAFEWLWWGVFINAKTSK